MACGDSIEITLIPFRAVSIGVNSSCCCIPTTTLGAMRFTSRSLYRTASSPRTQPSVLITKKSTAFFRPSSFILANLSITLFKAPLGVVVPMKYAFSAFKRKGSLIGKVRRQNPIVEGGPMSDCPRSASIIATLRFSFSAVLAR